MTPEQNGRHLADFLNTLRPRQNGRNFADDIFKFTSWMKMYWFRLIFPEVCSQWSIQQYSSIGSDNGLAPTRRPLSKPMMIILLTHICITWPQWVQRKSMYMYFNLSFTESCYLTSNWQLASIGSANGLALDRFCQSHRMGCGQHPNLKMDMDGGDKLLPEPMMTQFKMITVTIL